MMEYLPFILVITFIVLTVKDCKWGFIFFMVCKLIFPPIIRIGTISMNTLMASILLFVSFIQVVQFKSKDKSIIKEGLFPFFYLVLPLGIIGLFASRSINEQIKDLAQFFITEISPFISLMVLFRSELECKRLINAILISYSVIAVYGIFTYMIKMNPYYLYFAINYTYGYDVVEAVGDGSDIIRGALNSMASGNLSGPLPWGQESMLIVLFLLFNKNIRKNKIVIVAILLAITNTFLCGRRSCIIPVLFSIVYFVFSGNILSKKKILFLATAITGFIIVINIFPQLKDFEKNIKTAVFFWDDRLAAKEDVQGSSKAMRTSQFNYANHMVTENPMFGLGYGWAGDYSKKNGIHPVMLGFESIYFRTIIESGILGLLIWTVFFFRFYKYSNYKYAHKESLVYHLGFILSSILTGIQASMWIYLILGGLLIKEKDLIIKKERTY